MFASSLSHLTLLLLIDSYKEKSLGLVDNMQEQQKHFSATCLTLGFKEWEEA